MSRVEDKLTADQCNEIGKRIIKWFYTEPGGEGGRQFGCDWPTMRMIHPRKCRVFDRLKARYRSIVAVKNGGAVLLGHMGPTL